MIRENEREARALVSKGISALNAEDFDDAIAYFEAALDADPDNQQAREYLTTARQARKDRRSQDFDRLVERAEIASKSEDFNSAVRYFEQALSVGQELDLNVENVQHELASIRARQEQYERLDSLIQEGQQALRNGEFGVALDRFSRARALDPTNTDLRTWEQRAREVQEAVRRSEAAMIAGKFDVAAQALESALNEVPNSPALETRLREVHIQRYVDQGQAALSSGDYQLALDILERALRVDPRREDVIQLIGETRRRVNQVRQAEPLVDDAEAALIRGDYETAIRRFEEVLNIDPGNHRAVEGLTRARQRKKQSQGREVERLFNEARQALSDGDYDRSVSLLEEILRVNPGFLDAQALLDRAVALQGEARIVNRLISESEMEIRLGDYDAAVDLLEDALVRIPNHPQAQKLINEARLGIAHRALELNDYDKAISALQDIVQGPDTTPEAERLLDHATSLRYTALARERLSAHDDEGAAGYLEQALRLDPENDQARRLLDQIQVEKDREAQVDRAVSLARSALEARDYPAAVEYFEQALRLDPRNEMIRRELADARTERNRVEQVRVEKSLTRGRAALEQGDYQTAIAFADAALEIAPDDERVRRYSNMVRNIQEHVQAALQAQHHGDYLLAREHLDQALAIEDTADLRKRLDDLSSQQLKAQQEKVDDLLYQGRIALDAGRPEDAINLFDQALELDPTNHEAQRASEEARRAQETRRLEALLRQGDALFAAEDYDEAAEAYRQALDSWVVEGREAEIQEKLIRTRVRMNKSEEKSQQRRVLAGIAGVAFIGGIMILSFLGVFSWLSRQAQAIFDPTATPTPTATLTPTATMTPTPPAAVARYQVYLYDSPAGNTTGHVRAGDAIEVLEGPETAEGQEWYKVRRIINNSEGWMRGSNIIWRNR